MMLLFILVVRLFSVFVATWGVVTDSTSMVAYGIFMLMWANVVSLNEFAVKFVKAFRREMP